MAFRFFVFQDFEKKNKISIHFSDSEGQQQKQDYFKKLFDYFFKFKNFLFVLCFNCYSIFVKYFFFGAIFIKYSNWIVVTR